MRLRSGKAIKLIVLLTVLILALFWSVLLLLINKNVASRLDEVDSDAAYKAALLSEQINADLAAVDEKLRYAALELSRNQAGNRLKDLVESNVVSMRSLVQIAFVDASAKTIETNKGPDPAKTDLSDREHIRVHLDHLVKGLFIGKPVRGRVSGKWSIQVTRRVDDKEGRLIGVIVGSVDPTYFQSFWRSFSIGPYDRIELLGTDGAIRSSSGDALALLASQPDRADILALARKSGAGRFTVKTENNDVLLSRFLKVRNYPLLVTVGLSKNVAMREVENENAMYLGFGVAMSLILAGMGAALALSIRRLYQQAERLSAFAASAERANKAKSNFLATTSHEIRTPLNAIVGMSELLVKSSMTEEQKLYVDAIEGASNHLRTIVNNVLDFEQLECGRIPINIASFSPLSLISKFNGIVRALIVDKPVHFRISVEGFDERSYAADSSRLMQVMLNLAGNAVKFTDRGYIAVEISCRKDGVGAPIFRFTIEDSGIGLSPEAQEHAFEPFHRGDNSMINLRSGTGLGLSISRELVTSMKGRIGVQSTLGKGSVFWFEAPITISDTNQDAKERSQEIDERPARALRILVAEDVPASRLLVARMLGSFGHAVVSVENGMLAMEAIERDDFDIIILDISMPVMDGLEVTRLVRAGNTSNATAPIIALTAQSFKSQRDEAIAAGMNGFITKPFKSAVLRQVISSVLSNGEQALENQY